jgi:MFS family permease
LQCPLPSYVLWGTIAAAGAATVLSFAILTEYFPKEISGRANAALNLLHVGGAFILQSATGLFIQQWPEVHGTYPAEAHQVAMAATLVLQLSALAWFATPRRLPAPAMARAASRTRSHAHAWPAPAMTPYTRAALAWTQHVELLHRHAVSWRLAASASAMLCIGLGAVLSMMISRPAVAIHIFETDRSAHIPVDRGRFSGERVDHLPALGPLGGQFNVAVTAPCWAGICAARTDHGTVSNHARK